MMGWRFFHEQWHRRHHHHIRVVITIGGVAVELIPNGVIHMAAEQKVGQTTAFSIKFLDANGVEMPAVPLTDAPPAWSQTNAAAELLTAAADGETASAKGVAGGSDVVKLDLKVNGQDFTATIDMTVDAVVPVGPVLTSIEIVAAPPV
jgi:hypothetical protein